MRFMKLDARSAIPLVAVIAALVLALFVAGHTHIPASGSDVSVSELRASLTREILKDADRAYERLRQTYGPDRFEESHLVAHLFGEILYEEKGLGGIAVCDTGFNFGCYHGFVRTAVAADGFAVLRDLEEVCSGFGEPEAQVCNHGIGHGLLEYFGHDQLVPALSACIDIDDGDQLGGCMSGVFMEYNVTLSLTKRDDFQEAARPLVNPSDPYAPCDAPDLRAFSQACYHELPRWWRQVYPEDFKAFGARCEAAAEPENRDACFVGIAKIVPSSADFDVRASEALCAKAGAGNRYDDCIIRASWSFATNNRDRDRAVALCAFASEGRRSECPI